MEEILTKPSLADQRLEIPVRGDDDANVHWNWLITADALDFTFFQDAQQLGLHREGHVANFIEEDRAPLGLLKLADVSPGGAGE